MTQEQKEKKRRAKISRRKSPENSALRKLRWRFAFINAASILAVFALVVVSIYGITRTQIEKKSRSYLKRQTEQEIRILDNSGEKADSEPQGEGQNNSNPNPANPPGAQSAAANNPPPNVGGSKTPPAENNASPEGGNSLPSSDGKSAASGGNQPESPKVHDSFFGLEEIFQPTSSYRNRWGSAVLLVDESGALQRVLSGEPLSDENQSIRSQLAYTSVSSGKEFLQISLEGESYMLYLTPYKDSYLVTYLATSSDFSALNALLGACVAVAVPAFLVVLIISYFLSLRAVRPVESAWRKQQEFIADAAHELRTPIAVIRANTDVLALHPQKTIASQQKWLNYIRDDTQRMETLVNELLYLANTDSGQQTVHSYTNDISVLLREAVMSWEPLFFEKGLGMETDIAPHLYVHCDPAHMKKIFSIFLDNMLRHANLPGKGEVKAELQSGKATISFSNDALPLDEESLAHLFDRFYRNDRSRQHDDSSGGGYGLGLSIAQRLIKDSGGRISVKQGNGKLTFLLSWPAFPSSGA